MTWPFENDTSAITKKLAKESLKSEKRRNFMIIIAISLAAFLMSMCGTLFFAFQESQNNMATFQASYDNLTEDKIEKLRHQPEIEMVASLYNLGEIKMPEGYSLYLAYMDDAACYIARNQFTLKDGTMPSKENEIAVDREMVNKYFSNTAIGDEISFQINGKSQDFVISGITESSTESQGNYSCYISKSFVENSSNYNPAKYQSYVCFADADSTSKEILKERIASIGKEIGADYSLSFLFFRENMGLSFENILTFVSLSVLVLFAGITVIQSIFRISINEKIRNFGQLRTLGTTALQIKKMINYESRYLSWLGIPPGIVLGAIVGTVLGSNEFSSGFSPINIPFVMIGVSIICTLMVKLSVRKPLKIAATTSPIEAVRYIAYRNAPMQSRKHNKKISPYSLALLNLGRDKKKTASTLLSLIFGGLLLFISASAAVSNTPEQFVREKFFVNGGSFRIYLSEESVGKNEANNSLNESLREELLNTKGIQKIIPLRDSVGMCHYSINGNVTEGMCDIISDQSTEGNFSFVEQHLIDGQMLLPPTLKKGQQQTLNANIEVMCISASSKKQEVAKIFIAYCAEHLDQMTQYEIHPSMIAPVESTTYKARLETLNSELNDLQDRYAKEENDEKKYTLEDEITAKQEMIASVEDGKWAISPESIEIYRKAAEQMTIPYQSKFSSNGSDGFGMLSDVILQYCADGLEESEVNALIHELNRVADMVYMENH